MWIVRCIDAPIPSLSVSNFPCTIIHSMRLVIGVLVTRTYTSGVQTYQSFLIWIEIRSACRRRFDTLVFIDSPSSASLSNGFHHFARHDIAFYTKFYSWFFFAWVFIFSNIFAATFRHIAHRVYALALWVNDRHINSISAAFSEYIFYSHNVRFVEDLKASENVGHTDAHSRFSNFGEKKKWNSWSMYFPFQWD